MQGPLRPVEPLQWRDGPHPLKLAPRAARLHNWTHDRGRADAKARGLFFFFSSAAFLGRPKRPHPRKCQETLWSATRRWPMPFGFQECALIPTTAGRLGYLACLGQAKSRLLGQNTTLGDRLCFLLARVICWLDRTIIVGMKGMPQCIPGCFCSANSEAESRCEIPAPYYHILAEVFLYKRQSSGHSDTSRLIGASFQSSPVSSILQHPTPSPITNHHNGHHQPVGAPSHVLNPRASLTLIP